MTNPKWHKIADLKIEIDFVPGHEPFHSTDKDLDKERVDLEVYGSDSEVMGLRVNRLWMTPSTRDDLTRKLRIPAKAHGDWQLEHLSEEGLEILRNALGRLHGHATRILNERGARALGLAEGARIEPKGLPAGTGLDGPPGEPF